VTYIAGMDLPRGLQIKEKRSVGHVACHMTNAPFFLYLPKLSKLPILSRLLYNIRYVYHL